jgi:hypothetical protein
MAMRSSELKKSILFLATAGLPLFKEVLGSILCCVPLLAVVSSS